MKRYYKYLVFIFVMSFSLVLASCGASDVEETYSVTVKKCRGGTVSISPSAEVKTGQKVVLKIAADEGYEAGTVTVKDSQYKAVAYDTESSSFIMPSHDVNVSVLFNKIFVFDTYSVTLEGSDNGTVCADRTEGIDSSQFVTLSLAAEVGFVPDTENICIKDEEGNEICVEVVLKNDDTFKFKMPESNITVSVVFKVDDSWSYPVPVNAGRREIDGKYYDLVYFGVFPQTVASADLDESAFDDSRKVVMGGLTYCYNTQDKSYYCCVQEKAYGDCLYSDGSAVHKSSDNSYRWFKVEPVKWRVLETYSDGTALLFSDLILDSGICFYPHAYDSGGYYGDEFDNCTKEYSHKENGVTLYPNSYRASTIRAYLNGQSYYNLNVLDSSYDNKGFLQMAFTDSALELLQGKKIEDGVVDKIFLLSNEELQLSEYSFSNGQTDSIGTRKKNGTDFSLARYLDGTTWYTYTIKNIGRATQTTPYVSSSGYLSWQKDVYTRGVGVKVYINDYGVVPACIVKMGN